MKLLVAQLYPTLCDPMDHNPPGYSVHGITQARILKQVATPSPGDLPDPGIKPGSPALRMDSLLSEPPQKPQQQLYEPLMETMFKYCSDRKSSV